MLLLADGFYEAVKRFEFDCADGGSSRGSPVGVPSGGRV